MIFTPTSIPGAFCVQIQPKVDERGFFSRTVCIEEFADFGLNANFVQQSISFNNQKGILRGMHYQAAPHQEEKLVRATQGAILDVILDLRPESPAYMRWFSINLTSENRLALYIPKGVAHGFQTLSDTAELFYQMTVPYHPASARGVRWNDPAFGIAWPDSDGAVLSERDRQYEDFISE